MLIAPLPARRPAGAGVLVVLLLIVATGVPKQPTTIMTGSRRSSIDSAQLATNLGKLAIGSRQSLQTLAPHSGAGHTGSGAGRCSNRAFDGPTARRYLRAVLANGLSNMLSEEAASVLGGVIRRGTGNKRIRYSPRSELNEQAAACLAKQ